MGGRIIFCTIILCVYFLMHATQGYQDVWQNVECDEQLDPDNCDLAKIPLLTVEDYDRCAPAKLPLYVRNYYLGWGGRGVTYRENKEAFGKIFIKPRMLRDITPNSLEVTTLGQKVDFPVGISPTAMHKLANPEGEIATAEAAASMNTIMILSCYSTSRIEDVAKKINGSGSHLWLQLHTFIPHVFTTSLLRRAEKSGYEAIVLTVDSNTLPPIFCNAKKQPGIANVQMANLPVTFSQLIPAVMTFKDIKWIKSLTHLPVIAKGIVTGEDAAKAIKAGASGIIVSNHGGRLLDGQPSTIDALVDVMKVMNKIKPRRDVYMDGGIRNGVDVYKAIARGAKMVFVGRPVLWGLTLEGATGVKRVLNILKNEFNDTMLLSGFASPSKIEGDSIIPSTKCLKLKKEKCLFCKK